MKELPINCGAPEVPEYVGMGGGDDALPGWARRAGDRHGRSIASTILGGAMFVFLGLLWDRHVDGPMGSIGETLAWAGGGAWLFGCCWFVYRCGARRGWLSVLLRVNLIGVAAMWAMMHFSSEMTPELVEEYVLMAFALLPESLHPAEPLEMFARVFKSGIGLIFAWQALTLTAFCKASAAARAGRA